MGVVYLKIMACPDWEDATVSGVRDVHGALIPGRFGERWEATIRLSDGVIKEWVRGVTARICYKVRDEAEYYLLNEAGLEVAKYRGRYVPKALCDGNRDYIVLNMDATGRIEGYHPFVLDMEEWQPCA